MILRIVSGDISGFQWNFRGFQKDFGGLERSRGFSGTALELPDSI